MQLNSRQSCSSSSGELVCAAMDIDIDGVLSVGNLRPNWSDIRDGILPFPDIYAEEQYMNLQNARLNSAVFPEFEQPSDEMSMFLAQCELP
jgi:hypothetical protein